MSADDDRLGREHGAFLASVLGRPTEPEEDGPHPATPSELALYIGRPPERELTADNLRPARRTPQDDEDERHTPEPNSEASPDDVAGFFAALRQKKNTNNL